MLGARRSHIVSLSGEAFNLLKRMVQAERDQKADEARIDGAIARAENEIAALEGQLAPAELQKSINAIRDRTIITIRDVRKNMQNRINAAKNMQAVFLRRSLRFANDDAEDATLRKRFFELLALTPTAALIDHFHDAIDVGDIACAESIRFEFHCRADREKYQNRFDTMVTNAALNLPLEMQQKLTNIRNSAAKADARITNLLRQARSVHSMDQTTTT